MTIKLLFFSLLRDLTGIEEVDFPLPAESLSVYDLLELLFASYPKLKDWDENLLIAVNCEYANREDLVKAGDEVAVMPPVQGG